MRYTNATAMVLQNDLTSLQKYPVRNDDEEKEKKMIEKEEEERPNEEVQEEQQIRQTSTKKLGLN
jgi:hypothetical protein